MKKIMFYCQYLLGMGHLVRSTEILRSLVKDFQVCFINGGQIVQGFEIPPAVKALNLPALRSESGAQGVQELKVVDSSHSLEEVQEIRKNQLLTTFKQFEPDCLITEFFPFGRSLLLFELMPLLKQVQSTGRSTKVVCSLRDIVLAKSKPDRAQQEETICKLMNQYFDMLLVHSDPKLQRLEESFSRVKDLTCEVHYTGYVVQSPPDNLIATDEDIASLNSREPMILVSVGGGRLGHELLECMVEAAPILERVLPHRLQIFTGPFMPEEKFLQLQKKAVGRTNITLRRYTPNLLAYMEKADLSISLAGYNTIMNILRTRVRAMVFPSNKDREQPTRAEKLEQLGIVEVIRPHELEPNHFARKIITCLNQKTAAVSFDFIDLSGAYKTANLLKELLQRQVCAVYSSV
ncbi:glycosyltransferase family protein [Fischerella sp. PCC 9605]|uniref:glycosyltransferase family protein n=1 Tax=Fischerella sp. PCC 9605 TaxID=1173024 RepID=UPI00047C96CB|nr:glycosyltransferase [Fischerella sp. PCC 9605]